ncbi:membrane protein insertion efficiency factor YidD [Candidatus Uabimicrobium amorphum]|uniref:Membrane protein insertion efficiency factor YidD n=1 Tax=Uabimicrobium amorphum TaxID=2596890 RepID=A0A5S9IRD0_UABAM|nr:membrane protein insertion efficiency factor YidD [Candidatus Uabimicrobium amorphum]BBM86216.1 hypothetical protein UABAM_04602 [Candidatus Uabimicrobium amorphum]
MKTLAVGAINGYQKYISPYKGFCCAHRVYHGEDSCSQYAKKAVAEHGLWKAISKVRKRFAECREANRLIKHRAMLMSQEEKEIGLNDIVQGIRVIKEGCNAAVHVCDLSLASADCCSSL